jgi:acyl-CoA synthetase (AMP-forming)/AMP-acid ligase II
VYIGDRRSELIVSGRINVYPSEVEDAIVVGLPHETWGQAVTAAVVLSSGGGRDPAAVIEGARRSWGGCGRWSNSWTSNRRALTRPVRSSRSRPFEVSIDPSVADAAQLDRKLQGEEILIRDRQPG